MSNNRIDILSNISNISKSELQTMWQSVKANHEKLNNCKKHSFKPSDKVATILTKQEYVCINCGGVIDYVKYEWFELGRKSI